MGKTAAKHCPLDATVGLTDSQQMWLPTQDQNKSWQLKCHRGSGGLLTTHLQLKSYWQLMTEGSCFYLGMWLLAVRPGPGAALHTRVCTVSTNWSQGINNKSFKKNIKLGGSSLERALGESQTKGVNLIKTYYTYEFFINFIHMKISKNKFEIFNVKTLIVFSMQGKKF